MGAITFTWGYMVTMTIFGIIVGALALWLATYLLKFEKATFTNALQIAAIVSLVNFVLMIIFRGGTGYAIISFLVGLGLYVFLIKTIYAVDWGKAILAWLIVFVISLVAGLIFGLLFTGLFFGGMMRGLVP